MKYRLIRNSAGVPAGTVIDVTPETRRLLYVDSWIGVIYEPVTDPFSPGEGGQWYRVGIFTAGAPFVVRDIWCATESDYSARAAGNCYATREEAQGAVERVKAALQGVK